MNVTKMLEEIQMTPSFIDSVIGRVLFRTKRETISSSKTQPQMKFFLGLFTFYQLYLGNIPWFCQA